MPKLLLQFVVLYIFHFNGEKCIVVTGVLCEVMF